MVSASMLSTSKSSSRILISSFAMSFSLLSIISSFSSVESSISSGPPATTSSTSSSLNSESITSASVEKQAREEEIVPIRIGYLQIFDNNGAISLAIDRAKSEGLIAAQNVSISFRYTGCVPKITVNSFMHMIEEDEVDVVLGPFCSQECITVGHISSYRNILLMPESCMDSNLDNKTTYDTMLRIAGSFSALGDALSLLLNHFNWTHVLMLTNTDVSGYCSFGTESILDRLNKSSIHVANWIKIPLKPSDEDIEEYLELIREHSRIVIICHDDITTIVRILWAAQDRGMTDGDYAFFLYSAMVDTYTTKPWTVFTNITEDELTYRLKAFYALKQLLPFIPIDKEFNRQVALRNTMPPWNMKREGQVQTVQTTLLFDIAYVYLQLASEAMQEGRDWRKGREMFHRAVNRTFKGREGPVSWDSGGDGHTVASLWTYHPLHNQYIEVLLIDMSPTARNVTIMTDLEVRWGENSVQPPLDVPPCGFRFELCPIEPEESDVVVKAAVSAAVVVTVIISAFAVLYVIRLKKNEAKIQQMLWKIKKEDIKLIQTRTAMEEMVLSMKNLRSSINLRSTASTALVHGISGLKLGYYRAALVHIRIAKKTIVHLTRQDLIDLTNLKELVHDNIQTFIGACLAPGQIICVLQFCNRGCLRDILDNFDIKLDWFFRFSLISDLAAGMAYLHKSYFRSHGSLTSLNCLVDNRWTLRLSDVYPAVLRDTNRRPSQSCDVINVGETNNNWRSDSTDSQENIHIEVDNTDIERTIQEELTSKCGGQRLTEEYEEVYYDAGLWVAPELLRHNSRPFYGTQAGDVYSFAIVLQEIIYRDVPYFICQQLPAAEVLRKVRAGGSPPCRPQCSRDEQLSDQTSQTSSEAGAVIEALMERCWAEEPNIRPTFDNILREIRYYNKGRKFDIMDAVEQKLEKYATNLESIVNQRTSELLEEKKKTDQLLNRMLPPYVADELKLGKSVPPQLFPSVTIYFSDIVGFTNLSSESTPMQVVDILNDLYGMFDDTISRHDVYKVGTIGDAYMVVSGLPRPNNGKHVEEICSMALDLRTEVTQFKVKHRPDYQLMLRSGIHTGSCAAGVVGHTMPKYCLFGDTVNVASRMESTGEAQKIHLSLSTTEALLQFPGYITQPRGNIFLKGKGWHQTHWLVGKDSAAPD